MPNTKTKKFDFQVFLAVSLILLVICCSVICIVFDNTNNGVVNAYTAEEIGVSNLEFSVTDGFYFKNLSFIQLKNVVSYLSYYEPGLFDFTQIIGLQSTGGYVQMSYNNTMTSEKVPLDFFISQYSFGEMQVLSLQILVGGYDTNHITYFCDYTTQEVVLDSVYPFINNAGDYYFDLTGNIQNSETFANKIVSAILGADKVSTVTSIDSLSFTFNNTSNLGCLISANHTFAKPPIIMPEEVYNQHFQDLEDEVDRLNAIVQEQREDIQYYESLQLNMLQIPIFNIARCSPSTFEYNGVTYTSDTIERTATGWDIYSSQYLNKELPANYGVGFSLYLAETVSNTKFDTSALIDCWYNYNYNGGIATSKYMDFSVGYRKQNGQIEKVGSFSNDLSSDGEFVINSPTNEIVFFREQSNLMEVDDDFNIVMYQYDIDSIYNEGYDAGVSLGMSIGRAEGYNQGVLDANDYSFFSLFTSVFDAPITAIVGKWGDSDGDGVYQREGGMLNFYIPGLDINFAPFLLSLFTIGIIVLIIRFILARKS